MNHLRTLEAFASSKGPGTALTEPDPFRGRVRALALKARGTVSRQVVSTGRYTLHRQRGGEVW